MQKTLETLRRQISFRLRKSLRAFQNRLGRRHFATERAEQTFLHLVKEHRLPIYRQLPGIERVLFENKRRNLEIAIASLDRLIVAPGKTFSLWHLVGPPTAGRGFKEGLVLEKGRPSRGVGGGLCQLANALFWLSLHSELQTVERHHHSVDLFPDDHREVPFGTGATIVYNFKDLRFFNPSGVRYQFTFEISEREFVARVYSDSPPPHHYFVRESEHAFMPRPDGLYRRNTILREKRNAEGHCLNTEVLFHNFSKCQYQLQEAL